MAEEILERNEVRIAGKPIGIYALESVNLLKRLNYAILSTSEPYKEKTNNLIDSFSCFGITIPKDYKNGNVAKWKNIEVPGINENTGRRELKKFFIIKIERSPKLYMYTDEERKIKIRGVNLRDPIIKEDEYNIIRNEERVAGKNPSYYFWDSMCLFRKYDQIVIRTLKEYEDKAINLIDNLSILGNRIDKNYINKGVAEWKPKKINITNERTGRNEEKQILTIGLTKDPNTYMYTNEERKVEIE